MHGTTKLKLTAFMCRISWDLVTSTSWNPLGLFRPVMGFLYLYHKREAYYLQSSCIFSHVKSFQKNIITQLIKHFSKKCLIACLFPYIELLFYTDSIFKILGLLVVERTTSSLHKYRCYHPLCSFSVRLWNYSIYKNTLNRFLNFGIYIHVHWLCYIIQGYSKWLSGFKQHVIHSTPEIGVCSCTDGSRNSQSFLLWCAVCSSYAFLRLERSLLRYLMCIVYDKLLKPRQSFRITLYINRYKNLQCFLKMYSNWFPSRWVKTPK